MQLNQITNMNKQIKQTIITKGVNDYQLNYSIVNTYIPRAGDVALFKVKELGKHTRLQRPEGKNRHIFPGDEVLAVFGTRYATNQLEGYVPTDILPEYHILGQGGVMGELKSIHQRFEHKGPTTLELLAYATDYSGKVINTHYLNQMKTLFTGTKPNNCPVILSIGGSMDSGKTTTAGYLCRGLHLSGQKVAFFKLTGTVYSKDTDFVQDCGADQSSDFSYFGFPSTYMYTLDEILNLYQGLLNQAATIQPDYIVVEIADGLLQRETNMLLTSRAFMDTIDGVVYSDGNSTGAISGVELLSKINIRPFALCGRFTMAPLLIEEVQNYVSIPVLTLEDMVEGDILGLVNQAIGKVVTTASHIPDFAKAI